MDYLSKITSLQQKSVVSQERTFKKWINEKLKNRRPVLEVVNLFEDLKDGKILLALLEVLSHKTLPSEPISGVVTRIHSMNNLGCPVASCPPMRLTPYELLDTYT